MKSFIASLFAAITQAACEEDHEHYRSFSHAIRPFEYDWEPFTTTTDDGYILTMFRLTGTLSDQSVHRTVNQSVLIIPGLGMSADSWFTSPEHGDPMPIKLYESGYDVWLGNNRGTYHSMKHTTHSHEHDPELYWNWSFAEMGTYDLPAMFKHIKYTAQQDVDNPKILHTDKIVYIGYDQGATQMLYGLASMEESFFKDFVRGAVMLAPCTKMNVTQGSAGYHYYGNLIESIDMIGLYGLHGHNWTDFRPEVCAHLGHFWCNQERTWEENPYSARALLHYFQMGIEGRFQEYAESYLSGTNHRTTADIPIQNIKHTPIAVLYGDADDVCPMNSVEELMGTIGHMVYGNYQFGGYDHADFGKANDDVFMEELHEALSHLQPPQDYIHDRMEQEVLRDFTEEYDREEAEDEWERHHDREYSDEFYGHSDYDDYERVHLPELFFSEHTYGEDQELAKWQEQDHHSGFDLREETHHYKDYSDYSSDEGQDHFYQ